jgi:hypothetical protein
MKFDSVFRVLEPLKDKINQGASPARLGSDSPQSEWYRIYRVRLFSTTQAIYLVPSIKLGLLPTLCDINRSRFPQIQDRNTLPKWFRDPGSDRVRARYFP